MLRMLAQGPGLTCVRAGLEVQSWLRGEGCLPSFCPPPGATGAYPVTNIRALAASAARRQWNATTDHSKWAIAAPLGANLPGPAGEGADPAHAAHGPSCTGTRRSLAQNVSSSPSLGGPAAARGLWPGVGGSVERGEVGYGGFYGPACVGDLNRERGQLVRGGSALCFSENAGVWRAFRRLVATVEACGPRGVQ